MTTREMSASAFKQQCLAVLDLVQATKVRVVVTKRGKPVAQLVPLDAEDAGRPTIGSVTLVADDDRAYFSTGDTWSAEQLPGVILLDTHVLLWWQAGGDRLSARAAREIARADVVLVSPVSCWEVGTLVRKGRIRLDRGLHAWVRDLFAGDQVGSAALTPEAGATAGNLGDDFPGDPVDRLLWATAGELLVPLVSKDGAIRGYAAHHREVSVVW